MKYTKPIKYKELMRIIQAAAEHYNLTVGVWNAEVGDGDGKVSTEIVVKDGNNKIRIYDYKATNLYDPDLKSPLSLKRKKYEWHVQGDSQLLIETILNSIDAEK